MAKRRGFNTVELVSWNKHVFLLLCQYMWLQHVRISHSVMFWLSPWIHKVTEGDGEGMNDSIFQEIRKVQEEREEIFTHCHL